MKPTAPSPERRGSTHPAVHAPHPDLASCVRAFVTRSTVGATLLDHERHNLYPASLGCAISWTLQGQTTLVRVGDQPCHAAAPSPVMFTGPHSRPFETSNPGPVQFFLLMLMPDAFHALTGVDLQACTNQHLPLQAVLGDDWQAMAREVMAAPDDGARIALIEAFLRPRWQAARPPAWRLALRYVLSSTGRSLRQVERRVRQWTGQTQRQLLRLVRGEAVFLHARECKHRDDLVWSDLAADKGFSDQSHFCREFRKLTGLQPDEVLRNLDTDERLWLFKAWA